jgi:hypothetical protein
LNLTNLAIWLYNFKAQPFTRRVGLLLVIAFTLLSQNKSNAQFWKDWFKKKPEQKGVLGGKENLEERSLFSQLETI